MKQVYHLFLGMSLLSMLFSSCSDEKIVQPESTFAPVLSNLIVPDLVYNASQVNHLIAVDVEEPQGLDDLAEVSYEITNLSSGTTVSSGALKDDGTGGDNIPHDGQFSVQIQGTFSQNETGEFAVSVSATDKSGNVSNKLTGQMIVTEGKENLPPTILHVTAPTEIAPDSSFDFLITAEVGDPQGLSDIKHVTYQFFPPAYPNPTREDSLQDNGSDGDVLAGDGTYSVSLSSNIINQAGDYFFRIEAEDKAGNKSTANVVAIRGVFRNPQAPVIANLVAPDTVQIIPNGVVKILMSIDVSDPQGLSDINFVRFRSFLPGGNEATNSPFDLADDGNSSVTGDDVAGDGTYSILINLPSNTTPGDFRFVFQAEDKSGKESNIIEHILTVIQ